MARHVELRPPQEEVGHPESLSYDFQGKKTKEKIWTKIVPLHFLNVNNFRVVFFFI